MPPFPEKVVCFSQKGGMLFGERPSALVFTFLHLLLVELLEGAVHTGRLQHLPGRDLVSFSYSSGYIEWYASSRNSAFFVWLIHTFNTP